MNPKALNDLFDKLNIVSFKIDNFFTLYSFTVEGDDEYLRLVYGINHEIIECDYKKNAIRFITMNNHIKTFFSEDIQENEKLYFHEIENIILDFFSKHSTFFKYGLKSYLGYNFTK